MSATRPEGPNGPEAVPGKYSVRLTAGAYTATQPLSLVEDPRIYADGVTLAICESSSITTLPCANLVSDMNKTLARLRAARTGATGEKLASAERSGGGLDHARDPLQQAGTADPDHLPVLR